MKELYVVGLGPGSRETLTQQAAQVLESVDEIIGYTTYVELIRPYFPGKKFLSTPMRKETDRCRLALGEADRGVKTALISSGDAGIYGMAGLVFELGMAYPQVQIRVIPGITAAVSGAALLGAPLMHDFCVISLSDLMTPWEKIEKRLAFAAESDFVIVLYNPKSRHRADYLQKAVSILKAHGLPGSRLCGLTSRIGRDGETVRTCLLDELAEQPADMFTTVFIGNSETCLLGGRMVTPRGYRIRENGVDDNGLRD